MPATHTPLQPNYELHRDDRLGVSYRVPDGTEVESFRAAIEALPVQESPEIYGLHPNADLTFRTLQVAGGGRARGARFGGGAAPHLGRAGCAARGAACAAAGGFRLCCGRDVLFAAGRCAY